MKLDPITEYILNEQKNDIIIRSLSVSDAKEISDILNTCFPKDKHTKQKIEYGIKNYNETYYGTIYNNKIVGVFMTLPIKKESQIKLYTRYKKEKSDENCFEDKITFNKFNPDIVLKTFCILTKYRGLNLGNKMLDFITKKYKHIFLQTDETTSPQAYHLYKKFGFKDIDCKSPGQFFYL